MMLSGEQWFGAVGSLFGFIASILTLVVGHKFKMQSQLLLQSGSMDQKQLDSRNVEFKATLDMTMRALENAQKKVEFADEQMDELRVELNQFKKEHYQQMEDLAMMRALAKSLEQQREVDKENVMKSEMFFMSKIVSLESIVSSLKSACASLRASRDDLRTRFIALGGHVNLDDLREYSDAEDEG